MRKQNSIDDPALRIEEAAAYIGVARTTFYALINSGQIPPGLKFGRSPLWRRSTLNAFLDKAQEETTERTRLLKK